MRATTAVTVLATSLSLLVASIAVAQQQPRAAAAPRPPAALPAAPPSPTTPPATTPTPAAAVPGDAAAGTRAPAFEPGIAYVPRSPGARVMFNLQDADLPDLVRAMGNITGRRFIIGAKARSIKTTIYSPTQVTAREAYQAFLSALNAAGMTVYPAGAFLRIDDSAGAPGAAVPTYSPGEAVPRDERFVTRIHRLRSMSADDAAAVLTRFKSAAGDVTPHAATSTLILTDTGANVRRMVQILAELDVPSVGEQIWVERLRAAGATETAQRLTETFAPGGASPAAARPVAGAASSGEARPPRIIPDERSNSLIIVATERTYLRVLEMLRRLDVELAAQGEVHVHYLEHADAEDVSTTLNQIVTGGGGGAAAGGGTGGSAAGAAAVFEGPVRVTANKGTNALVVTASPRDFASVRHVVAELDRARRQVFIEAVVMELEEGTERQLGVSFHGGGPTPGGTLSVGGLNPQNTIGLPGSLATQDALQGLALGVAGPLLGTQLSIPNLTGTGTTTVPLPLFGVALTALAQSRNADILATPSIVASNHTPAELSVGADVPTQINAGTQGTPAGLFGIGAGFGQAPRAKVGTRIRIVPHINAASEIRLEIEEEISDVGDPLGTLGARPVNERRAKTTVVVPDQQTVVIAGLIRSETRRTTVGIPVLGDLPVLGALFRTEGRSVARRNLVMFLTPYILRDHGDLRRIFERKMRDRQEFLDRYFVFSDTPQHRPEVDWTRTNGIVEELREALVAQRLRAAIEGRAHRPPPPAHEVSAPIDPPDAPTRAPPDESDAPDDAP